LAKSIALALLHQGLVRRHNENNLFILDSSVPSSDRTGFERAAATSAALQFYAVADGMGGGGIGDVAAQTVLLTLEQQIRYLRPGSRLDFPAFARELTDLANRSVCEQLASYQGMPVGTTFSLLAIDQDHAYTLSLGNSRIYLYRNNQLHCLTEDHVSQLPDRRQLTRYLGYFTENVHLEPENLTQTALIHGDVLLLTTDGVTNSLTDGQIAAGLSTPGAFVQQIRHLRDNVLRHGGRDDLALIGVKILEPLPINQPDRVTAKIRLAAGGSGQSRSKLKIKGSPGFFQEVQQHRLLWPLLFFLAFVLLGILLGKILFSLPAWLNLLFP
jgi:PPM family protein phosphatase